MRTIKESKELNRLPELFTPVKISDVILEPKGCGGFLVNERHIDARKAGLKGVYRGYVPGAGGDVWWVEHEDKSIGAYLTEEVNDLE